MTDLERLISETIKKNQEIIVSLTLQNQALSSQLPQQKIIQNKSDNGYFTDPYGKKVWYDKKAEARHKRRLTLIPKEVA